MDAVGPEADAAAMAESTVTEDWDAEVFLVVEAVRKVALRVIPVQARAGRAR